MQRIAVPMIGGMMSSTLLTLVVIPAIFALLRGARLPSSQRLQSTDRAVEDVQGAGLSVGSFE